MRHLIWLAALAMPGVLALAAPDVAPTPAAGPVTSAPAPSAPQGPLSLADAVALALRQNPNLAAVRQDLPAALARLRLAEAGGKLLGSASAFLSTGTEQNMLMAPDSVMPRTSKMVPPVGNADLNGYLLYPLYTGGRVSALSAAAGARVEATRSDIDSMVLDTAYAARAAYWRVLLRRELLKVQEENLAKQRERLRVDTVALDAGKIPSYYVLRDKAEVADAEQGTTNATRDVDTALLSLCVALGLPPGTPLDLSDKLIYHPSEPVEVEKAVADALRKRPETLALAASVQAARRDVSARRAAYKPQVNALLMADGVATSGNTGGGYTLGVVAALPILDGGSRAAEVGEAEARLRRVEQQSLGVDLEVERQVRTALLDRKAAEQNVRTAMEALASADEDYRVALVRYEAGKAINLEPLSALATLVKARTNLVQALYEYNLAQDAFLRSAGELP